MEREYNVGTWLTPSDEYIKDIKQTLVEKGVATELTPNEELSELVKKIVPLQQMINRNQAMGYFFNTQGGYRYTQKDINEIFALLDTSKVVSLHSFTQKPFINTPFENVTSFPWFNTSNVTDMTQAFVRLSRIKTMPLLDYSKVTTMNCTFGYSDSLNCEYLEEIEFNDTSKCSNFEKTFYYCKNLKTIKGLNGIKNATWSNTFDYCKALTNLDIKNICNSIRLGSGKGTGYYDYGHLLTLDSLVNTCKECIKQSSSKTLTVGTANLAKLANVYVRFVDRNQTTIPTNTKGEVEVCEADNNDAMTITEYMSLKNWTLA